jgi:hypothetical protein
LSGCGGSGEDQTSPSAGLGQAVPEITGKVPELTGTTGLGYPLDDYLASTEERAILEQAQDVLVDQCMQRYGYSYVVTRPPPVIVGPGDDRRYGLTDAAHASERGYARAVPEAPQRERLELAPHEQSVLYGPDVDAVPPANWEEAEEPGASVEVGDQQVLVGGCLREGYLQLYAPTRESVDIMEPQAAESDAYLRSREDTRVRQAVRAWSECMAGRGYTVTDPVSPQSDLGLTELDGQDGIASATADVACKAESNLIGVWYTVEVAYQEQLVEENAEMLNLAKSQHDERLRLAADLTGRTAGST